MDIKVDMLKEKEYTVVLNNQKIITTVDIS